MTCKHSSCKSFFRGSFEELWNQSQFLDLPETVICLTSKLWQCLRKRRRNLLLLCCSHSHRTRPSPRQFLLPDISLLSLFYVNERKLGFCLFDCLPVVLVRFMTFQIRTSEISKIQVTNNTSYLRISKGKFLYNKSSLANEDSWKCIWGLDFLCQRTNLVLKMTLNSLLLS